MKITLNEVEAPMFTSFTMFAEPNFELLKEKKEVTISFRHHTKTRISTSLQFGDYCVRINFSSKKFKTHNESSISYFSMDRQISDYFVKSKKQDFEAYKEYVKEIVEYVMTNIYKIELDELTINLQRGNF